ncbi:MAG: hypothetical protein B6U72_03765 [Candidatus Altiarchaeales archaeon ex4484_2]|nr:MAG: hypothetical protein B6U72_03765 [Candidatus Altiarchaeales archaeon ex4484_2]
MSAKRNNKLVFAAVFLLIACSFNSLALDENKMRELAELHYEEASSQYSVGNCRSAISNANRSRSLFSQLGDQEQKVKASILITQINECLSSEGDEYYVNTVDIYNDGNALFDTKKYSDAKVKYLEAESEVLEANTSYSLMEPPDDILLDKVEELFNQIRGRIRSIEINQANDYYSTASRYYFDYSEMKLPHPKYLSAKEYSKAALNIYLEYNYSDGIYKAQKLLNRIIEDMVDIRKYAEGQKEMARDAFEYSNFLNALDHYKKARDAYILIESTGDVKYCEHQIELVNRLIELNEQNLKTQAGEYYNSSENAYLGHEYSEALNYLNQSRSIYIQLRDFATARDRFFKQKEYRLLISKCDDFYDQIIEEVKDQNTSMEAGKLYDKAFDFFKSGNYERAFLLVNDAWSRYMGISDYGGMSNCERLNESITGRFKQMSEAKEYYNKSRSFYEIAYFDNATYYADKSLGIYQSIKRDNETLMVQQLISEIKGGIKKKEDADKFYREAVDFNNLDELDYAEDRAKKSSELYKEIHWEAGIDKSKVLLDEIREKMGLFRPAEMLRLLVPVVIAIVIAFIGIRWYNEREMMVREKRKKEEAERRRIEAERLRKLKELDEGRRRRRELVERARKEMDMEQTESSARVEEESAGYLEETHFMEEKPPRIITEESIVDDNSMESAREKYASGEISRDEYMGMMEEADGGKEYRSAFDMERETLKEEDDEGKSHISVERERIIENASTMNRLLREERDKIKESRDESIEKEMEEIKDLLEKKKGKENVSEDSGDM